MKWLTSIRSIVTFLIVATFCILAGGGKIPPKDFLTAVMLVLTFYFALKERKPNE